jgi:hypothetical protein
MRNGDTEADPGAHRFFTLFQRRQNTFTAFLTNFAKLNEQIDQLDYCRPPLGCLHVGYDLVDG